MNRIQGAGKFRPVESGGICWPPGLSAQLLLLIVSMIVIGGHRAKFPLNPDLCLCFYLCNGVRRYFRSQKIIIKELAPVGHKESNAFLFGVQSTNLSFEPRLEVVRRFRSMEPSLGSSGTLRMAASK